MGNLNLALGAALLSAGSYAVAADKQIEEIVVTASFRPATELATPQSITVIDSATIRARAAAHFEDIIDAIPNMNFDSGTGRARFFQIRGIGEREQFIDPVNPSVGLIIDDVDFSGAGTIATMLDVDQVEVLRGPQGTRYGANALAGLINIKTNDPQDEFSANVGGMVGKYATASVHGVVTGPLSDNVDYRLAGRKYRSDGYTYNAFLHRHDVNKRAESTVRGKLKFDAGNNFRSILTASVIDVNDGYDAFSLDNSGITLSDQPGHDSQKSTYLVDDATWQLAPFNVKVIASVADSKMEYGYDEDWTYTGFDPNGYSSTDYYYRTRKTQSIEARLVSNDASRIGGNTDWVTGVYLFNVNEDLRRVYTYLASDFYSTNDFTTAAAFFQFDTAITDATTVSEGLRIENRQTSYDDSNAVSFRPGETLWGGQLTLKHIAA
ncbi:MAG TPA: TonB-dependent receptor plug domain-containing protein, partial [Pseudomonadales bacterium]|nr:TonB-dependent receptor plug domain-containing protein [Pseudomonadales bacterium]